MSSHAHADRWRPRRHGRRWVRRAGFGALGTLGALLAYGIAIEPRFIYERDYEVRLPNLPPAWRGRRVALSADFQVGMFLANTDTIRRLVRRLIAMRPDAFLFAGDFIYHPSGRAIGETATVERLIRPLVEAGIPVIAVLGNHDYGVNMPHNPPDSAAAEHLRGVMERLGVYILHNSWVALPPPGSGQMPIRREQVPQRNDTVYASGLSTRDDHVSPITRGDAAPSPGGGVPDESLYIVGIGPYWLRQDSPEAALRGVPPQAARIALMHNPDSFPKWPAYSAPFAVAGHTHGGQIRVPDMPHWSYLSLLRRQEVHADGWTLPYGQAGNEIYVNIGVGFSGFPARINCVPELTTFTLQPPLAGPDRWVPRGKSIGL